MSDTPSMRLARAFRLLGVALLWFLHALVITYFLADFELGGWLVLSYVPGAIAGLVVTRTLWVIFRGGWPGLLQLTLFGSVLFPASMVPVLIVHPGWILLSVATLWSLGIALWQVATLVAPKISARARLTVFLVVGIPAATVAAGDAESQGATSALLVLALVGLLGLPWLLRAVCRGIASALDPTDGVDLAATFD